MLVSFSCFVLLDIGMSTGHFQKLIDINRSLFNKRVNTYAIKNKKSIFHQINIKKT